LAKKAEFEDPSAGEDIAAMEAEAERERLLVGLISLTEKIVAKVDATISERIVQEKDLVNEIFKEFLFPSSFSDSPENT
jgi:hypothetical protein